MTEKPKKWPGLPGKRRVEEYVNGFRVIQNSPLGISSTPGILEVHIVGPLGKTEAAAIRAWNRAVDRAREGK